VERPWTHSLTALVTPSRRNLNTDDATGSTTQVIEKGRGKQRVPVEAEVGVDKRISVLDPAPYDTDSGSTLAETDLSISGSIESSAAVRGSGAKW